jgi:hypothetical protein
MDERKDRVTVDIITPFARRLGIAAAWLGLAVGAPHAAPDAAGRWIGTAQIPGAPMRVVVDLAPSPAGWIGSVILPGRGVKGAPLNALQVDETGVRFGLSAALRFGPAPPPQVHLRWQADGTLAGDYAQAGHRAALVLRRSGAAQVDSPDPPTVITADMHGLWRGRYELGGAPRIVTLTLQRAADGFGSGELLIVGRRTSRLPIDHIVQGSSFITLRSTEADIRIEGRWGGGEIQGLFVQGPFEAPLTLRRDASTGTGTGTGPGTGSGS